VHVKNLIGAEDDDCLHDGMLSGRVRIPFSSTHNSEGECSVGFHSKPQLSCASCKIQASKRLTSQSLEFPQLATICVCYYPYEGYHHYLLRRYSSALIVLVSNTSELRVMSLTTTCQLGFEYTSFQLIWP
jgi:hypothetical protein